MENLRDQAVLKLHDAYELCKSAGISERFIDLAEDVTEWKEFEKAKEDYEYFKVLQCSVCGDDHTVELIIKKDAKHNWQHTLEFVLTYSYYGWSFWSRLKEVYRDFKNIMFGDKMVNDIFIKGDDLTKFKDLLKKL
ncbi:MAG: hypothetical protein EHM20_09585 [Alphaproteobacteria bacterium]|nr:MAG: hypothetical protein EHM20_09585 [Alphaproteobacteria bacterium]